MTFGDRAEELAGFAATLLGWTPAEFWNSTPAELETALGRGQQGRDQIERDEIERLLAQFPDSRGR